MPLVFVREWEMVYECVINISEGRDATVLQQIVRSGGASVVDLHQDIDHNRSVITIASYSLEEVFAASQRACLATFEKLSFRNHIGVHPRLGIIDVVPFVSYNEKTCLPTSETIEAAKNFGAWINKELDIEVFYYDWASKDQIALPFIRKNAFSVLSPDLPSKTGAQDLQAVCVGAREPLIAINVNLDSTDLKLAKKIARDIRESSGGIPGVRAIGLELESQNKVQVSMNIVDCKNVNAGQVCLKVIEMGKALDIVSKIELVGLVPEFQYEKWTEKFITTSKLSPDVVIENRMS